MMMQSARKWTPLCTVLLVSGVRWRPTSRLSITAGTTIEVDPDILEAQCLRKSLQTVSNIVNQKYSEDGMLPYYNIAHYRILTLLPVFDIKIFESAVTKLKFTLADLDES